MRLFALATLLVASGLTLSACDSVGSDTGRAQLSVRMTDEPFPFDLADSANVTITRIELLAADADMEDDTTAADSSDAETEIIRDRIVLFDGEPFSLNLLDLRDGIDTLLVERFSIPADGSYNRLRIYVGEDASVVFSDGSTYGLKLPSAMQSGIKVTLPDYDFEGADGNIDVLIDFNVEDSFVARGTPGSENFNGFLFKPVLKVQSFEVQMDDEVADDDSGEEESTDGPGDGSAG